MLIDILDRRENPLLERIEIRFRISHDGEPTPSRRAMCDLISSLEPGSKSSLVILRDVGTRFGRAQTTGFGMIYANEAASLKESAYVRARFSLESSDTPESTAKNPAPTPKVVPEEEAEEE